MSIYADIKFNMKDGYPEPILYHSQCGEFRDVAMELSELYNRKYGLDGWSQSITLFGEELEEFGMFYAQEVACESIEFLIENDEHDWCDSKTVLVCNYYEKGKFTIEDSEIAGYNCEEAQAFMPLYNLYEDWAYQNALDGDVDIETNLPIFKRYVQMTLEGKMFFGVQISKIESVTLELG